MCLISKEKQNLSSEGLKPMTQTNKYTSVNTDKQSKLLFSKQINSRLSNNLFQRFIKETMDTSGGKKNCSEKKGLDKKGKENRKEKEAVLDKPAGEKKKCDGQGLMLFQKQNNYLTKKKQLEKKERKKMVDRLRYLLKKEKKIVLSRAEVKEKKYLQTVL